LIRGGSRVLPRPAQPTIKNKDIKTPILRVRKDAERRDGMVILLVGEEQV
jgi:hypothetical protein